MKYWIDTEFIAKPFAIDLVSIGLVAEDGREFYAESSEVDWSKASPWMLENVRPQLEGKGMSLEEISYALRVFTDHDEHPVFWGYFPAYDWVAFVGLFGGLEVLPFHYPQLCLDIKQWAIELGDPELPHQKGNRHHALADARWTRDAWDIPRKPPFRGRRASRHRPQNPGQFGAQPGQGPAVSRSGAGAAMTAAQRYRGPLPDYDESSAGGAFCAGVRQSAAVPASVSQGRSKASIYIIRPLPDARDPFAANARSILGITQQFALQSRIFQIGANDEHDANQCRRQERPERTERKCNSDSQNGAGNVARVTDKSVRTCRDHMMVAIGLDAHARLEMPVDSLRPSRAQPAQQQETVTNEYSPSGRGRPAKAAVVEPSHDQDGEEASQ